MEEIVEHGTHDRRRYRPPIGIPGRPEARAEGTVVSVLLHTLIIVLILAPTIFATSQMRDFQNRGAGGRGPAGGGGGGIMGNGGIKFVPEKLNYVKVAPPALKPEPPKPKPEEKQKPLEIPRLPEPPKAAAVDTAGSANGDGTGGTGRDGSAGSGPGSGGGVGSGVGTGRGSANGPGTGGGTDEIFPAMLIAMPILPIPVPSKVRPYKMVAYFEVDSLGTAKLLSFTPTRDSNYNKRVREMLLEMRFRPAVRGNGTPVRDTVMVTAEAM